MIPQMPRRLTQAERRARTRRRLLDGARSVFVRRGFGAATLDEIAEAAGLTRGALHYNFPGGKDELLLALLDERVARRAAALERIFADGDDASLDQTIRRARAAAHEAGEGLRTNREWRLLLFEFALHAARERRFARKLGVREHKLRKTLIRVIRERTEARGVEPPLSPEKLALGITALGNGLALEDLIVEGSVPENLFEELIGFLILGVATAAGTGPQPSTSESEVA
jgi:AcrR family transcriptional regulator